MKSFCIGTRAWIVVLVILLVAPVQLAVSQQQFGRTSATGTWDDGNWERSDGSLGSPGTVDDANIGYQDYGWLGNVSVSLSGNAEVANLILGDGTNTGALTINTGANMTTGGLFSYSGSSLIVDGSLFVDYAFLFGTNFEINGSVNVSSYIEIDGGVVTRAGDVSAQSLSLGRYGEATIFNRTSGTLTLDSLRVDSGSSLALGSGDSVRYAEVVGNGSTLIVDSPFSFANGLNVNEGSLVLNSSIDAGSIQLDNAVITRFNDASLTTSNLSVSNMTFDLDGTDNVSDSVSVSNATLNILTPTSLAGSINSNASMVNIEADTSLSYFSLNGSTLNLNANLDLNSGTLITNGGAIHQNGDLSSGSLHLGWAGEATIFNRTSGTLTLDSLRVDSGSSLALGSGDSVRYAEVVGNGSTLIVDSPFSFANGLNVNEGSLVLNSSIDAGSIQLDNAVITRFNDASLTTSNLSVSNMTFDLDGTDNVSDSVSVSNATLNILTPTSLAGSINSNASMVNIEADTSLSYFSLNGSTLNLNANLDLNSGTLITNGGTINQNGNISGNLDLGWGGEATIFNRTSGTLMLDSLRVYSGSTLDLTGADSVNFIAVAADSELSFTQLAGQTSGLDLESLLLDSDANLTVIFDNPDYNGFNWGLRVFGDRQSEMNDWLAGGQLSSNFAGAGIFYDISSFGDYTYLGAFSAVPEPASISLVFLALACGTVRMRRRRVGR